MDASRRIFVKVAASSKNTGPSRAKEEGSHIPTPMIAVVEREQDSRKLSRRGKEGFRVPEHYVHSFLSSGAGTPSALDKYDLLVADQDWLREFNRGRTQPLDESLVEELVGLFEVQAGRRTRNVSCISVLL